MPTVSTIIPVIDSEIVRLLQVQRYAIARQVVANADITGIWGDVTEHVSHVRIRLLCESHQVAM